MEQQDIFFIIFFILGIFAIGFLSNEMYRDIKNLRDFDGMFIQDVTYFKAREIAENYDNLGDWVCINTKGMDFNDCVMTARHECGHEIFAEYCEDNWEVCSNLNLSK